MQVALGIFCALIFTSALFGGYEDRVSSAASSLSTNHEGIVIPLYTYPTDGSWAEVIQAKQSYPSVPIVAIINPNSGPGSSKDVNYLNGIGLLENAGVTVIGYVATGYGTSSYSGISNLEHEVGQYKTWYPKVQGIFFDEMSGSATEQSYFQTLKDYVGSLGMQITFGNPGTTVDTALVGIFSNLVIYENPGMPSVGNIDQYLATYGSAGFSFISYGIPSLPSRSAMQSLENYVSYIYITNSGGSNPYAALPSYYLNEVASLAASATSTSSHTTVTSSSSTSSITSSSSTVILQSSTTSTSVTSRETTTATVATSTVTSSSMDLSTSSSSASSRVTVTFDSPAEVNLTVSAVMPVGAPITGLPLAFSTANGSLLESNHSPAVFVTRVGQNYTITPQNYGTYVFSYWNDTRSTIASRSIELSQPTKLVAVYFPISWHPKINIRSMIPL